MLKTAREVVDLLQQRDAFLSEADETLAERDYAICVNAGDRVGELTVPRCLRHSNTQVIEAFNANWSDPDTLEGSVLPHLENLCAYWENVHQAHRAALKVFRDAAGGARGRGYCLYLRSFAHVFLTDVDTPQGRAVAYLNTEALDRNVAHALAAAKALNAVSCLHPDDMALLEGRWLMPAFRVHDHDWKAALSDAIVASKLMVFYLGAHSDGAAFELAEIRRTGLRHRTVIVYEKKQDLPADAREFAGAFAIGDFVRAGEDVLRTHLTAPALRRLQELAGDGYAPPPPAPSLARLPCNVVDPKVPMDLPAHIDPAKTFCLTPGNLTAFAWVMVGLPEAMLGWNAINRRLYDEQRAPTLAQVNELLRHVTMACIGAAALGLTATLSAAIGLRVITAHLVVVADARQRERRKRALLRVLDIADRFDALTVKHRWRRQNDGWREMIRDDHVR